MKGGRLLTLAPLLGPIGGGLGGGGPLSTTAALAGGEGGGGGESSEALTTSLECLRFIGKETRGEGVEEGLAVEAQVGVRTNPEAADAMLQLAILPCLLQTLISPSAIRLVVVMLYLSPLNNKEIGECGRQNRVVLMGLIIFGWELSDHDSFGRWHQLVPPLGCCHICTISHSFG